MASYLMTILYSKTSRNIYAGVITELDRRELVFIFFVTDGRYSIMIKNSCLYNCNIDLGILHSNLIILESDDHSKTLHPILMHNNARPNRSRAFRVYRQYNDNGIHPWHVREPNVTYIERL